MWMDLRPVLSSLSRHKTAALLIVLEIALSCALVCNAVFVIGQRLAVMNAPSVIAEDELVRVKTIGLRKDDNADARTREDIALLRGLPGVRDVTIVNQVPYGQSSWGSGFSATKGQVRATAELSRYMAGEHFLETLGLRLLEGRDFLPEEYLSFDVVQKAEGPVPMPPSLLSRSVAMRMFPDGSALGKQIWEGNEPSRVVGIVDELPSPNPRRNRYIVIQSLRFNYANGGNYLLRVAPGEGDRVLKQAGEVLDKALHERIIFRLERMDEVRARYFRDDRALAWLLGIVSVAMLLITALGIVGLASFWVQQRTQMIGVRRALGATRQQILRYFQLENLLLTGMGVVVGMVAAYGINFALMKQHELPPLPLSYLPVGTLVLLALGQIAVLGPALRAAAVPPVVATRGLTSVG